MSAGRGFDFGTSPHGLLANLHQTDQETRSPDGLRFLADAVDVQRNVAPPRSSTSARYARQGGGGGQRSGQTATASGATMRRNLLPFHYLELTDFEFLQLRAMLEQSRNRFRKAFRRGLVQLAELKATDSLWKKLQEVKSLRLHMKGGRA